MAGNLDDPDLKLCFSTKNLPRQTFPRILQFPLTMAQYKNLLKFKSKATKEKKLKHTPPKTNNTPLGKGEKIYQPPILGFHVSFQTCKPYVSKCNLLAEASNKILLGFQPQILGVWIAQLASLKRDQPIDIMLMAEIVHQLIGSLSDYLYCI